MTNPKRYSVVLDPEGGDPMEADAEGSWVRWEDCEVLRGNLSLAEEGLANYALEIERLREVLTIPNITPDTTSSALFIRTLSEHEKGQPVNAQDLINALMWRVKNQRKEIARLQEKRGSPEPGVCACIPLAPRPAKYCSDCGKLIPQGASRDASSDESCTYCGRMWGDEKTTRCPLQGEELRCHARKP